MRYTALLLAFLFLLSPRPVLAAPSDFEIILSPEDDPVARRTNYLNELKTKASQGDAEAQFKLADELAHRQSPPQPIEAEKWLRKAAEGGYASAQFSLGVSYSSGGGSVKIDNVQAEKWFRKAAEQGHGNAQESLAHLYYGTEDGSIKKNLAEVEKWTRKAAEQGFLSSQNSIGRMYYNGEYLEQNYTEAVAWFTKSADSGDTSSQLYLAKMYKEGTGVDKNYAIAETWYKKLNERDYYLALELGLLYAEGGYGIERDNSKAAMMIQKSADSGNLDAKIEVGNMYREGRIVPKDYRMALDVYRKLVYLAGNGDELGIAGRAQAAIGLMYLSGQGVKKDIVKAYMWLLIAAENESKDAGRYQELALKRMIPKQITKAQQMAQEWKAKARQ